MVKLDVSLMRFLEEEDYRVLTALEMAMRNHEVAPTVLIEHIAQLPHGGVKKRLNYMLKHKLIHHESRMYDGYAMKYAAYDFLALRAFSKRGTVTGVGSRIGCGKESDIIHVEDGQGHEAVLKLQRLGRCSFRTVARNRDYKGRQRARRGESWFYLSRLAAQKEFMFMSLLHEEGFPVPKPIDQNRHGIVMEKIDGVLLNHIETFAGGPGQAQRVYERCLSLMVKLAEHGLIHGDFNEFNLLIRPDNLQVVLIDFPQMVSTDHPNAAELFDRDVQNMAAFFERRHRIPTPLFPSLERDVSRHRDAARALDKRANASGVFTAQQQRELDRLMRRNAGGSSDDEDEEGDAARGGAEEDDAADDNGNYDDDDNNNNSSNNNNNDDDNDDDSEDEDGDGGEVAGGVTIGEGAVEDAGTEVVLRPQPSSQRPRTADGTNGAAAPMDDNISNSNAPGQNNDGDEAPGGAPKRPLKVKLVQRSKGSVVTLITAKASGEAQPQPQFDIDQRAVQDVVRRAAAKNEEKDFHRALHRNTQKGREKMKMRRQQQANEY